MKETITFNWDKETKAKQRFSAPEGSAINGSIYVPKEIAGDVKTLTVTIEGTAPAAAATPAA